MRGNSIGENPLLVIEIEGECAIKMKLIDGQEWMKHMSYSIRRPHGVRLLSDKRN